MNYVCQNQFFSAVLTHWGTVPVTHRLWGYFFYTRGFLPSIFSLLCAVGEVSNFFPCVSSFFCKRFQSVVRDEHKQEAEESPDDRSYSWTIGMRAGWSSLAVKNLILVMYKRMMSYVSQQRNGLQLIWFMMMNAVCWKAWPLGGGWFL